MIKYFFFKVIAYSKATAKVLNALYQIEAEKLESKAFLPITYIIWLENTVGRWFPYRIVIYWSVLTLILVPWLRWCLHWAWCSPCIALICVNRNGWCPRNYKVCIQEPFSGVGSVHIKLPNLITGTPEMNHNSCCIKIRICRKSE